MPDLFFEFVFVVVCCRVQNDLNGIFNNVKSGKKKPPMTKPLVYSLIDLELRMGRDENKVRTELAPHYPHFTPFVPHTHPFSGNPNLLNAPLCLVQGILPLIKVSSPVFSFSRAWPESRSMMRRWESIRGFWKSCRGVRIPSMSSHWQRIISSYSQPKLTMKPPGRKCHSWCPGRMVSAHSCLSSLTYYVKWIKLVFV